MPSRVEDRYLGDGVYASFDGYQIWLDLRAQDPRIRIALDKHTLEMLVEYANYVEATITTGHTDSQT